MDNQTTAKEVPVLRLPALEIRQGPKRLLYSFAVDGKVLHQFAAVSRIHRSASAQIRGYQRPEVRAHINEIRQYIESEVPILPNALVIAFDHRVQFVPADVQSIGSSYTRVGTLMIPLDPSLPQEDLPGWIVDGQQRAAAIRDAAVTKFPVCVTAFITADADEQREQFILVNSTKPLPKGLIYELLPSTHTRLPSLLQRRRFPAYLVDRLNYDEDSPFRGLIHTPTNPTGYVKDNSVLRMIEQSISEGALYKLRDSSTGTPAPEPMLNILKAFWGAVASVFSEAWNKPPRRSRLMHGAGIVCMGLVMDAVSDRYRKGIPTENEFVVNLAPMIPVCSWTTGYWEFGPGRQRKWNEIQNTSKDIFVLANYLLFQYKKLVWDPALKEA
jgi:DGQHR domain-containing protein